jgi:hypothetical protein
MAEFFLVDFNSWGDGFGIVVSDLICGSAIAFGASFGNDNAIKGLMFFA